MRRPVSPPRGAQFLLRRLLPNELWQVVIGDLEEELHAREDANRTLSQGFWYWRQVIAISCHFLLERLRRADLSADDLSSSKGDPLMYTIWQDLRYGARMLRKNPGFAAIAIIALALGVGANTALFSVVNAVLLRPLPYQNADELVTLYATDSRGETEYPAAPAAYLFWKQQNSVFADVAALSNKGWTANLTAVGEPARLQGFEVSANLFTLLGISPALGRTFLAEEDRPGAHQVVVVSYGLWQRSFGGDPSVLGRVLTLNNTAYTIIGVMPQDFQFYRQADLWTPLALSASEENNRQDQYLVVLARRKPGVTLEQARADLEAISRQYAAAEPNSDFRPGLMLPQEGLVRETRSVLLVLFGAVGFVLLIACANVANLLLARSGARRKELAIRVALGASRLRVMRQLLAEGLLLALIGGGCGLLVASWVMGFLIRGLPDYLVNANARVASVHLDFSALLFTLALSLLTSIFFGLAPALHSSRIDLNASLKEGSRHASSGRRQGRLRAALVVSEIALSLILLVGAGLMMKSLWQLSRTSPGFDPSGVLTLQIDVPQNKYPAEEQTRAFYNRVVERVAALPGVRHVGVINSQNVTLPFTIDEHPAADQRRRPLTYSNQVSPDYFRAMGIPLRQGRTFTEGDREGAQPVIIINEALARRYFPNEDPIGQHLRTWDESREIVGVVGTDKVGSITEDPQPRTYLPYLQQTWSGMSLIVRAATGDPTSLAAGVKREIQEVDQYQPVYNIRTLEQAVSEWVTPQRFITLLLGGFAAVAAMLAAVGVYGVISYTVTQRTHEIGVRVALGARATDVVVMVVGQGMRLACVGVVLGLMGALALTRVMDSLLYGVSARDPLIFALVTLMLGLVALIACLIPARRAAKVDPLEALRYE